MSIVVVAEMNMAVVGAPTDIAYSIMQIVDAHDIRRALGDDLGAISMNLPLLVPQVEGVDFPFFTRLNLEPEPRLFQTDWQPWIDADFLAPDPSLLATPPSTEPLFNLEPDQTSESILLSYQSELASYVRRVDGDFFNVFIAPIGQATYSDTVCRMLSEIQRHMLEPVIDEGVSWQLWTEEEVRGALEERLSGFLLATGLTRERLNVPVEAGQLSVEIPESIIEIRRVQWDDGVNQQTLLRSDEMQLDNSMIGWESDNGAVPAYYVEQPLPTLSVLLNPVPALAGALDMVVVLRPSNLAGCAAFPIPAMFVPYIKYGVMADMLRKEGEANDPERATYCEKRFAEGIDLARALLGVEA
jgi:hypothetical protein